MWMAAMLLLAAGAPLASAASPALVATVPAEIDRHYRDYNFVNAFSTRDERTMIAAGRAPSEPRATGRVRAGSVKTILCGHKTGAARAIVGSELVADVRAEHNVQAREQFCIHHVRAAAKQFEFEKAAQLRDRVKALKTRL